MPRRVYEVQSVCVPVLRLVVETYGAGLDGDAVLTLKIHVVKKLILHLPRGHRPAQLDEPVGQGGLPVIHMGDDGEISYKGSVCHVFTRNICR